MGKRFHFLGCSNYHLAKVLRAILGVIFYHCSTILMDIIVLVKEAVPFPHLLIF